MKNSNKLLQYCAAVLLFCSCILPLQAQKNVILDTDMGGDCDDTGALAVLHALADNRGEAILLILNQK